MPEKSFDLDIDLEKFDSLVDHIYVSALDTDHWPVFIQHLVEVLNAKSAILRVQHLFSHEVGTWIANQANPRDESRHQDHFVKIDPSIPADQSLNTDSQVTLLGIQKSDPTDCYTVQEISLIKKLTPHLQRAIKMNRELLDLKEKVGVANKTLDRLPIGVIFVDKEARPVFVNRKYKKLSSTHQGLIIRADRLVTNSSKNTATLNKLIAKAGDFNSPRGGSLTIDNLDKSQSLNILVTPVNHKSKIESGITNNRVIAALFISTADHQHNVSLDILKGLFSFTKAESQLASALANGHSLETYADKQGISKNTVRNQLKSCFNKTGVKRQADLVKLIVSGVPTLTGEDTVYSFNLDD